MQVWPVNNRPTVDAPVISPGQDILSVRGKQQAAELGMARATQAQKLRRLGEEQVHGQGQHDGHYATDKKQSLPTVPREDRRRDQPGRPSRWWFRKKRW